jgi:hypothetical protein
MKPPFRPLGPAPQIAFPKRERSPEAGVAAADNRDVRFRVAGERGRR